MKTLFEKRKLSCILFVVITTVTSMAFAGYHVVLEVSITSNGASGTMSAARFSSDGVQYIGCETRVSSGYLEIFCHARDEEKHYISCSTNDPAFLPVVSSISSESFISFTVEDDKKCKEIQVTNASYLIY
jgi:hypothetical protein